MQPANKKGPVLTLAVVGIGYRAQDHLSTIGKLSDMFRLTAVCDVVTERVNEVAQQFQVNGYTDTEEMLRREQPDVVLIAAPVEDHHVIAEVCATHGAHVLCETPISMTIVTANRMIAAAQEHDVHLEIAENVWRRPVERFKRMLIENGIIGDVQTARLWYSSGSYHGINALRMLVGAQVAQAVGAAKVLRKPLRRGGVDSFHFQVFAPSGAELPPRFQENTFSTWEAALLEFENGVVATYEFPLFPNPFGNRWDIHGSKGYISGTEVVTASFARPLRIMVEHETVEGVNVPVRVRLRDETEPVTDLVWENPYVRYRPADADEVARIDQFVSIYRAATENIPPTYGAENGVKDLEVLVAIRESAMLGSVPIRLPLTETTAYEKALLSIYEEDR